MVLLHRSLRITLLCRYLRAWDSRCIMDQLVPCAPAPAVRNKESTVEQQALWNITITKSPPPDLTPESVQCSFQLQRDWPRTRVRPTSKRNSLYSILEQLAVI